MPDSRVSSETKNNISIITINNPPVNSLSSKVIEDLDTALTYALADKNSKCILITGYGQKSFASGADIRELETLGEKSAISLLTRVKEVLGKILACPKPTIAAINGHALGGGLELALHCDFRLAVEKAKLGLPEINLGVMPAAGGTQLLPELIGMARARWLLLSGEMISAQRALEIGLIDRLAENNSLLTEAAEMCEALSAKPPLAYHAIKKALDAGREVPFSYALREETDLFGRLCATQDKAEGIRAFLEKRPPRFTGR
ncbi:MAG: enoyl-CoA hydratase/isomerase family protein [Desulfobacteraceae bacterium]|nr:enoyl-CoA hydratase/isomerase family protein [Desulfobacteraceae bacterium]